MVLVFPKLLEEEKEFLGAADNENAVDERLVCTVVGWATVVREAELKVVAVFTEPPVLIAPTELPAADVS